MRHRVIALLAMSSLAVFVTGCATKGYVRNNVSPVQAKLDQVADQSNKQGEQLQQTRQDVDKNTTAIAGVDEKASGADRRAGDAMTKANEADQKGVQNTQQIASLRNTITNLENYKVVQSATVLFPFNQAKLKMEDKQQLDQLVGRGRVDAAGAGQGGRVEPTASSATSSPSKAIRIRPAILRTILS